MDLNESGNIDFRELQRGVMNIPELSEIIAPGRVREAMDTIKRTQGLMTREDFLKFCKRGASINRKLNLILDLNTAVLVYEHILTVSFF